MLTAFCQRYSLVKARFQSFLRQIKNLQLRIKQGLDEEDAVSRLPKGPLQNFVLLNRLRILLLLTNYDDALFTIQSKGLARQNIKSGKRETMDPSGRMRVILTGPRVSEESVQQLFPRTNEAFPYGIGYRLVSDIKPRVFTAAIAYDPEFFEYREWGHMLLPLVFSKWGQYDAVVGEGKDEVLGLVCTSSNLIRDVVSIFISWPVSNQGVKHFWDLMCLQPNADIEERENGTIRVLTTLHSKCIKAELDALLRTQDLRAITAEVTKHKAKGKAKGKGLQANLVLTTIIATVDPLQLQQAFGLHLEEAASFLQWAPEDSLDQASGERITLEFDGPIEGGMARQQAPSILVDAPLGCRLLASLASSRRGPSVLHLRADKGYEESKVHRNTKKDLEPVTLKIDFPSVRLSGTCINKSRAGIQVMLESGSLSQVVYAKDPLLGVAGNTLDMARKEGSDVTVLGSAITLLPGLKWVQKALLCFDIDCTQVLPKSLVGQSEQRLSEEEMAKCSDIARLGDLENEVLRYQKTMTDLLDELFFEESHHTNRTEEEEEEEEEEAEKWLFLTANKEEKKKERKERDEYFLFKEKEKKSVLIEKEEKKEKEKKERQEIEIRKTKERKQVIMKRKEKEREKRKKKEREERELLLTRHGLLLP